MRRDGSENHRYWVRTFGREKFIALRILPPSLHVDHLACHAPSMTRLVPVMNRSPVRRGKRPCSDVIGRADAAAGCCAWSRRSTGRVSDAFLFHLAAFDPSRTDAVTGYRAQADRQGMVKATTPPLEPSRFRVRFRLQAR